MEFNTAWLTTNRTCNNRCEWCYARNTLGNTTVMDFEKAKKAVNELKRRNIKRIILIGGEPTIYPHFVKLIKYISDMGIPVSVASNGRKFNDFQFAEKTVKAGINGIDISLKGLSEEEYKINTGMYGLDEMLNGYNNLLKLGFNPSMSYVITEKNPLKIEELISFLKTYKISRIFLGFVKPVLEEHMDEPIMDLRDMGNIVENIYENFSVAKIDYSIEISFPLCLIKEEILQKLTKENRIVNCCHVPSGRGINFDENFRIIPCNHFAEYPFSELPIDFSNSKSIDELYQSEEVKKFRNMARCYPSNKCQECNLWSSCGGGCFTNWLCFNPDDYIK